ncbi:ATP-binding cassette domain-containing protein [Niabella yanshanensis]|uniref:ATP-binding cassette domain-containing protein n=1 Tax=Niabella yanshanensis TaxID=577386 RepID=A0ABZ0W524_9BACT|nr:ATP-binding cassette domain-containing protein [Niabella yanshanensis]WQD36632.1 ATP-binding cassette domain-containing protein [Niabella yanshanensis]
MRKQELRVAETLGFLESNDINLGFRRLLDCVADTQDMELYQQAIALTDWKEQHPQEQAAFIEKAKELLHQTGAISLQEWDVDRPVVVADDIRKQYRAGGFSLGPISVSIKKGQVYGLVGENGNGKTTLLRLLAKELHPDGGTLQYDFGTTVEDEFELRAKLVYIPQRTKKWYGSLKDNLKLVLSSYHYPPQENEPRVLLMIARLGLWNYKHLKWHQLSSGYKMRFELARTLLRKPELLLLDEPLANLDVLAQQIILEDLKSIANSVNNPIALILSSQQLYEVEKISDKVIYLKNGQYSDNEMLAEKQSNHLIAEIETTASREQLNQAFEGLSPQKIAYNGGVYIVHFDASVKFDEVLSALGRQKTEITYIRNISHSTRQFFVA